MKVPLFGIEISPQNGLVHVAVSGELDIATAPRLDAALQESEVATGIVLDLTRVSFIDSTGLRVLLQAHDAARHRGRQLTILPSDIVTRLICMTGFSRRLLNDAGRSLVDERDRPRVVGRLGPLDPRQDAATNSLACYPAPRPRPREEISGGSCSRRLTP